jgi:hypothetical protein
MNSPIAVQKAFAPKARSFVSQIFPCALLSMPGCHGILGNRPAAKYLNSIFPVAANQQAADTLLSEESLTQRIAQFETSPCFCYPRAIVAILTRHCVLERVYEELLKTGKSVYRDIAAFLCMQDGDRTYQIHLTEMSLCGDGFLNVQFMALDESFVKVRTTKVSSIGSATSLTACVEWLGNDYRADEFSCEIENSPSHNEF